MSSCHTPSRARRAAARAGLGLLVALTLAAPAQAQAPVPAGASLQPSSAGAAHVQLWHAAAREAIARTRPNQQAALRLLAYLALAQHETAQSLQAASLAPGDAAWAAAFDRTSADLLTALVPSQAASWQALAASLAATRGDEESAAVLQARALAAEAARRIASRAATDGFDTAWTGALPEGAQAWRSQLQPARPPHLPQLGWMKTVYLASAESIRVPAPPQPGTAAFDSALGEVRTRAVASNTAGLARAKRWEMVGGSLVAGFWDETAAELARRGGLDGAGTARVLALALGATLDANIVCHRIKYTHWVPRPSQADAAIRPLLGLPNHPSYPSNHSCDSMAAAVVLGALFPREKQQLEAMAREAGESRIEGGIHYRFDVEAGEAIGRQAAAAALRSAAGASFAQQQP